MPQVTLGTSANQDAIAGNPNRLSLTITNLDSTNVAYVQPTALYPRKITATAAPFGIGPGLTLSFSQALNGKKTTTSAFAAICTAGTPTLSWGEGVD